MPIKPAVNFTHTQSVASSAWTINHGLNCYPSVDVYVTIDDQLTKLIPKDVLILDKNTLQVIFSEAQKGLARLV